MKPTDKPITRTGYSSVVKANSTALILDRFLNFVDVIICVIQRISLGVAYYLPSITTENLKRFGLI